MRPRSGKATTDQLRDDIDQGRTGEKVRFPDPAAAPLGTDDEAAGNPPAPDMVAEVRRAERARAERIRAERMRAEQAGVQVRTWLMLAAVIAVIALLLWLALR